MSPKKLFSYDLFLSMLLLLLRFRSSDGSLKDSPRMFGESRPFDYSLKLFEEAEFWSPLDFNAWPRSKELCWLEALPATLKVFRFS